MVLTIALASLLASNPAPASSGRLHGALQAAPHAARKAAAETRRTIQRDNKNIAVDLHPMTDDEKKLYPGRERFDKTEWYESLFKSAKVVPIPEHVDDWHNGGRDVA